MDLCPTPDDNMYRHRFSQERQRLLATLGAMTEGGSVEAVEHVGATSVPDLLGQPIMDIALSVWPFPLKNAARAALARLLTADDSTNRSARVHTFCARRCTGSVWHRDCRLAVQTVSLLRWFPRLLSAGARRDAWRWRAGWREQASDDKAGATKRRRTPCFLSRLAV